MRISLVVYLSDMEGQLVNCLSEGLVVSKEPALSKGPKHAEGSLTVITII